MTSFAADPGASCDHTTGCITCGDEAVAMRVLELDSERGLALCADDEGREETVETALVHVQGPGDVVLVHAATAIACVEDASSPEAGGRELLSEGGAGGPSGL